MQILEDGLISAYTRRDFASAYIRRLWGRLLKEIKLFVRLFPIGGLVIYAGSCILTSVTYEKREITIEE